MRCLILITLCFALANACWLHRFQKLVNRHQNGYTAEETDEVDDYLYEEVKRVFGSQQCTRGSENVRILDDEEFDSQDDMVGARKYKYSTEENIETPVSITEVEEANVKLATRLYKQAKDERDDKNTVVSPLSVQLALAALTIGARGKTRSQIGRAIGGESQTTERKHMFKTLIRKLKGFRNTNYPTDGPSTKIETVTGIFISQTTPAQQTFIQQIKSNLGASVKHCKFSHQPQQCRQMINQWVSEKTHHKINSIVPQDAITDNTKMILVNSLELKATWGPQMRRHVTKEAKFYPLSTNKVKVVEVMETEGRFNYYEDELVKIVALPTAQNELTFYMIVPNDKDKAFIAFEELYLRNSAQLKQLLEKTELRARHVGVQLPKFQIKHKLDVRQTLRKQGVTAAFDPECADFSGITGISKDGEMDESFEGSRFRRRPNFDAESDFETADDFTVGRDGKLHLNKFIHQATIKVTEDGITASTDGQTEEYEQLYERKAYSRKTSDSGSDELDDVTGFFGREPTSDKIVKANRAFAFVVKHNPTNQLLLIGRVIDAAQKKVRNGHQTINTIDQL